MPNPKQQGVAPLSEHDLPSGRRLIVGGDESLELHSPEGTLELRIELGPDGPVVQLRAARLQLESADAIALRCREFSVEASDSVSLSSGDGLTLRAAGDIRQSTEAEIHITGAMIYLN